MTAERDADDAVAGGRVGVKRTKGWLRGDQPSRNGRGKPVKGLESSMLQREMGREARKTTPDRGEK